MTSTVRPQTPSPPFATRRPDASMFLITDLEARPLDPGYAQAAVTKAANPGARRRPWMNTAIICTAVAVGFGAAMSTNALRIPLPDAREARLVLEQQIRTRNEAVTQASERIDALTAEISALQTEVADPSDDLSAATILFDGLGNGTVAVTGPGLVITLTDGGSGGLGEQTVASLVRDSDIQQAVQALWAAGAEAIAVGDQRLTMTTAIRNAGAAVLVDLTPVPGPTFVITAIGDPAQLEAGWVASPAARYFRLLSSEFGINSTVAAWDILAVPARSQNLLHFATPMDREIPQ